jgi:hypothetical protein
MYSIRIDTAITNIPTTFQDIPGSRVAINVPANTGLQIINNQSKTVSVTVADYQKAPSSSVTNQFYCLGNGTNSLDEFHISNRATVYIRSDEGLIKRGVIYIHMWGKR